MCPNSGIVFSGKCLHGSMKNSDLFLTRCSYSKKQKMCYTMVAVIAVVVLIIIVVVVVLSLFHSFQLFFLFLQLGKFHQSEFIHLLMCDLFLSLQFFYLALIKMFEARDINRKTNGKTNERQECEECLLELYVLPVGESPHHFTIPLKFACFRFSI